MKVIKLVPLIFEISMFNLKKNPGISSINKIYSLIKSIPRLNEYFVNRKIKKQKCHF